MKSSKWLKSKTKSKGKWMKKHNQKKIITNRRKRKCGLGLEKRRHSLSLFFYSLIFRLFDLNIPPRTHTINVITFAYFVEAELWNGYEGELYRRRIYVSECVLVLMGVNVRACVRAYVCGCVKVMPMKWPLRRLVVYHMILGIKKQSDYISWVMIIKEHPFSWFCAVLGAHAGALHVCTVHTRTHR